MRTILILPFANNPGRGVERRSHCGNVLGESGVNGEVGAESLYLLGDPHEAIECSQLALRLKVGVNR